MRHASMRDLEVSHCLRVSASPPPAAGGLITAVRKTIMNGVGEVRVDKVVPGRAMTVHLKYDLPQESLALTNMHNFALDPAMRGTLIEHSLRLRAGMTEGLVGH